jgi:hypothetical protein
MDGISGDASQVATLQLFWVNTKQSDYQHFYNILIDSVTYPAHYD